MPVYMTEKNVETLVETLLQTSDFRSRVQTYNYLVENLGLVPERHADRVAYIVTHGKENEQ